MSKLSPLHTLPPLSEKSVAAHTRPDAGVISLFCRTSGGRRQPPERIDKMAGGTPSICYESAITASPNKNNLERRRGIHRRPRRVNENGGFFRRGPCIRRGRRRSVRRRGRCVWGRRRGVRRRRQSLRRRRRATVLQFHRKEHVVRESCLVGARAAEVHTAALTAGHRRPIGQCHRSVATVPTTDQGVGRGPILEPPRQQRGFLVSGIKSISKNWPISRGIRNPRSEPRTIGSGGRIPTRNIRGAGDLIDQRHQCCNNDHGQRG
jgi:hypothetical protein